MNDNPETTDVRPLDSMDRHKIVRILCGGDSECDFPCDDWPPNVWGHFRHVMEAIEKAGCVVMAKKVQP